MIMNDYTVLLTVFRYGSEAVPCKKEDVRNQCERLKALSKIVQGEAYMRIEAINNQTGEISEYWNNKDNKIEF